MVPPAVPAPAPLPAHLRHIQVGSHGVVEETDLWAILLPFLCSLEQEKLIANIIFCFVVVVAP